MAKQAAWTDSDVDAAAKLLIEPMEQNKDTLSLMEKAYTNQRERIAQKADFARQQRYADRVRLLRQYGWEHNYELDAFGFKESLWIDIDDIRDHSDEVFAPTLAFAREGWEREQERLKEEKRLADEVDQANAQKRVEDDKRKSDRERSKRLAKDKNLLHKFFVAVGNPQSEIPENAEAIELRIEFVGRLHDLVKEFTDRLPTL